jgi:quercetin dioxygenase-like cupin family protein
LQIIDLREGGHAIERFNSQGASVRGIASELAGGQLVIIRLEPRGILGRHEAVASQLFIVTAGSGVVSGFDDVEHQIEAGQAAYWVAGEIHETVAGDDGITAVVLEGSYDLV